MGCGQLHSSVRSTIQAVISCLVSIACHYAILCMVAAYDAQNQSGSGGIHNEN